MAPRLLARHTSHFPELIIGGQCGTGAVDHRFKFSRCSGKLSDAGEVEHGDIS